MSDVTPAKAEALATKAVGDFISACHLQTEDRELLGNVLMKLVSVAGIAMAAAEGKAQASHRLRSVAGFVMKNGPVRPQAIVRIEKALAEGATND